MKRFILSIPVGGKRWCAPRARRAAGIGDDLRVITPITNRVTSRRGVDGHLSIDGKTLLISSVEPVVSSVITHAPTGDVVSTVSAAARARRSASATTRRRRRAALAAAVTVL
jgi:hypothetical protein